MPGFCSSQEETDTRIILYIACAQSKGYHYASVRSPDSDFFIILHYANMYPNIIILLDTDKGSNKKLLNITEYHFHRSIVHCSKTFMLSQDATKQVQ